jgi:hypothetical protein
MFIKEYIYIAIVLGLLGGFGWYTYHERQIGAQKIELADKKVADAQAQHVKDVQALASAQEKKIESSYNEAYSKPVTDAPVARLCHIPSSRRPVPAATAGNTSPASAADSGATDPSGVTVGPDIGIPLVEIGRHADAEITALQAEVAELREEMISGNTGHH